MRRILQVLHVPSSRSTASSFRIIYPDYQSSLAYERLPIIFVTGQGSMINVRFSGLYAKELQTLYYFHMLEHKI